MTEVCAYSTPRQARDRNLECLAISSACDSGGDRARESRPAHTAMDKHGALLR
ncbi:MAG: hypothetical protein AB1440_13090 [Pseudomonadota bacterium]